MKMIGSILCLAVIVSSCQENKKVEAAPLLKSDTTFVVKPELPVQEQPQANNQTGSEEEKPHKTIKKTSSNATTANTGTSNTTTTTTSNNTGTTQTGTEATQKKGWTKTAKGAVIGGVVGAGTGAVVNKKNRVAGAVIGGVLGAGAGAVIGNQMDKKDGRH